MTLPSLALSVRQPWAWAIVYGFKPLENRSAKAISFMSPLCGRRAIHASKGLTQKEYDDAAAFMRDTFGLAVPAPDKLHRGGIIGAVDVTGVVRESDDPWFSGPRALVLANAAPCVFVPAVGALGYFRWQPADASVLPAPARWMRARVAPAERAAEAPADTPDLFYYSGLRV